MPRFDVHRGVGNADLLIDCQANLLGDLNTRFVVPLLPREAAPAPARRLNPTFEIAGRSYVMVTQFASAIPARDLGPCVVSLIAAESEIVGALDMLLCGY